MDDLFDDPGEIIAEDGIARVRAYSTEQSRPPSRWSFPV
jgi:hypothetical protein